MHAVEKKLSELHAVTSAMADICAVDENSEQSPDAMIVCADTQTRAAMPRTILHCLAIDVQVEMQPLYAWAYCGGRVVVGGLEKSLESPDPPASHANKTLHIVVDSGWRL